MTTTTTRNTIRTISIQIPNGTDPGDTLEFQVDGQSLEWVVPSGSQSGDLVEIQVMVHDDDDDDNEDEEEEDMDINNSDTVADEDINSRSSIEIGIGHDTNLEFALRLPADVRETQKDQNDQNDNMNGSCDDGSSDGTFALPWQSGIVLAKNWDQVIAFLCGKNDDIHSKRRILELGSGLGVVGISLAASHGGWHPHAPDGMSRSFIADGADIVLTDLPAALPLLDFNTHRMRPFLSLKVTVSTRTLRWSREGPAETATTTMVDQPYDCLLGSDLLYNSEEIPNLVATMKRLLHPLRGVVVLAVRWRKPELEREFFQTSGLEWELIPLQNGRSIYCPLSWNEFGNPSCEASNKFFHQTQVSLNGTPTSIADISEEQARVLPKDEFQAWEQSFIQIYLGRPKRAP